MCWLYVQTRVMLDSFLRVTIDFRVFTIGSRLKYIAHATWCRALVYILCPFYAETTTCLPCRFPFANTVPRTTLHTVDLMRRDNTEIEEWSSENGGCSEVTPFRCWQANLQQPKRT